MILTTTNDDAKIFYPLRLFAPDDDFFQTKIIENARKKGGLWTSNETLLRVEVKDPSKGKDYPISRNVEGRLDKIHQIYGIENRQNTLIELKEKCPRSLICALEESVDSRNQEIDWFSNDYPKTMKLYWNMVQANFLYHSCFMIKESKTDDISYSKLQELNSSHFKYGIRKLGTIPLINGFNPNAFFGIGRYTFTYDDKQKIYSPFDLRKEEMPRFQIDGVYRWLERNGFKDKD